MTLAEAPPGDPIGDRPGGHLGSGDGRSRPSFVTIDGSEVRVGGGLASTLAPGDSVRLDNSWVLALQYYHRYQVPAIGAYGDLRGWDQFRDANGEPTHPQRPILVGPVFAGVSGGVATGRFDGKMIVLASVKDIEAFPWSADWYQEQVRAGDGRRLRRHLPTLVHGQRRPHRLRSPRRPMRTSCRTKARWNRRCSTSTPGSPKAPHRQRVRTTRSAADNQIELAANAAERGGVQPVVSLTAVASDDCDDTADEVSVEVAAGDPVSLSVIAELPPDTGEIVRVEWDFESTGEYLDETALDAASVDIDLCETHAFDTPGTYFAVVRVTAQRDGDIDAPYGLIQNLARVRIVVT